VAVIIAAYQAARTIGAAVDSALAEPEVTEVWVVDDASQDDTAAVARTRDDGTKRLNVVRLQRNGGPAPARNVALDRSAADWVCVLDADDLFLPGRIERLLAHAGDADLIADEPIRVAHYTDAKASAALRAPVRASPVTFRKFVEGNISRPGRSKQELGFVKPLMRRAFLEAHRLRYRHEMRLGEDYEFYARALALGARMILTSPMGYVAVERAGSLSGKHSIEDLRLLRDCDTDLARLDGLGPADRETVRRHFVSVDKRLQWRRLIEAVKSRELATALTTFTSPAVSAYLAARLAEQAWLRSTRALIGRSAGQ
jgi:succinoglycan biosynthesis protein ExoU